MKLHRLLLDNKQNIIIIKIQFVEIIDFIGFNIHRFVIYEIDYFCL